MSDHRDEKLFDELIDEFVAEIRDLLDTIEPDFLAMEESGDEADPELINRAFRSIHSIKGSAGFAGFEALKTLSHAVENVLMKIREGEISLDPDKMDAMLAGMDKIRFMVDDIHVSNNIPYADELTRLEAILKADPGDTRSHKIQEDTAPEADILMIAGNAARIRLKTDTASGHVFEVGTEAVAHTVSDAMYIFALRVYADKDLKEKGRTPETFRASLEETGRCLAADAESELGLYHFLFGTILEPEFIVQLFEIPHEQIFLFERSLLIGALPEEDQADSDTDSANRDSDKITRDQADSDEDTDSVDRNKNKITLRANAGPEVGEHLFEVGADELGAAVSEAMYIFALWVYKDKDLKEKGRTPETFKAGLGEAGRCLVADMDAESEKDISHFLFGSILESEFITKLFEIPEKQVFCFERSVILEALERAGRILETWDTIRTEETPAKPYIDTPPENRAGSESEDRESVPDRESAFHPDTLAKAISEKKSPESASGTIQTDGEAAAIETPSDIPAPKIGSRGTAVPEMPSQIHKPGYGNMEGSKRPPAETIRVSVELVDKLMNLVGEMVLGRNQLHRAITDFVDENPQVNPLVQNLNVVITEVQENIMQMRMQPVANVLNKFPRIVRDLSRQVSKDADIIIRGEAVELDKSILEGLSNPLTHLVRNCVDHGIEPRADRVKMGKPGSGRIHLEVFHDGGQVHIIIKDDGKGIDAEKVTEKALKKGILTPGHIRRMSENEKLNLIFLPGISTAETITDISGRGVGMDVVKTNISKLGGHIDIESVMGEGTTVHITIPLTLAIIPSLIVGAGEFRFAIPQINVQELVCINPDNPSHRVEKVGGSDVLRLRGRLLPLVSLPDILGIPCTFTHPDTGEELPERRKSLADQFGKRPLFRCQESKMLFGQAKIEPGAGQDPEPDMPDRRRAPCDDLCIVVLRVGMNAFGLHVNALFDNEEIVVKPLSEHIKDCINFSGATIMGDGRVAMILDAAGIASYAQLRFGEIEAEERRRQERISEQKRDGLRAWQPILIFNNALNEYFALPLAGISRLERIEPRMIERVGEQEFLFYHNDVLPLIRLEKLLPISPLPEDAKELFIIIPKTASHSMVGIIVSRILDAIDSDVSFLSLKTDANIAQGFWGSVIFNDHLTFFLNTEELVELFEKNIKT